MGVLQTQRLMILVLATFVLSGCSSRHGLWKPFSKDSTATYDNVGYDSSNWTGVEPDFPYQGEQPQSMSSRFSALNPFRNWGRSEDHIYEGDVNNPPACRSCGTAGVFPINGQCNNCVQETVNLSLIHI